MRCDNNLINNVLKPKAKEGRLPPSLALLHVLSIANTRIDHVDGTDSVEKMQVEILL